MPSVRAAAALVKVARRMHAIDAMSAGPAKEAALAEFLVEAEATGDPDIIVATLVEAYISAYNSGRWDAGVAPLVRMVAAYARHRDGVGDMVHRAAQSALETTPEVLVLTPTTRADHLDRALDDIAGLLRDGGRSDAPVEWGRALWAAQRGDDRTAGNHLDRYLDDGGVTDVESAVCAALLLAHLGREEEAGDELAPHRGRRLRRSDVWVGGEVVEALVLVARGDHAAARASLAPAVDRIATGQVTGWQLADHGEAAALLARLGDSATAVAAADTAVAALDARDADLIDVLELCAHAARAHRSPAGDPARVPTLVARAEAAADRFDTRNGVPARRRWVAEVVAAPDLAP